MEILISGAGIAGPAAALALRKAGIPCELYEPYPEEDPGTGSFVTLTANGQDALAAIDADQPVLEASFDRNRIRVFSPDGHQLVNAELGQDHPAPRTITRAGLARVLCQQAANSGIPVHRGKRLATAETSPDGKVTASFADGTRTSADLLIGADGVHSPIRTFIDPDAPSPRYIGLLVACGYADRPPAPASADSYDMHYGHQAFFGCMDGPDNRIWWFARIPRPEPITTGFGNADQLAQAFDADGGPAAAIIRNTRSPITITSAYDIAHLPRWSNDTMIVIGDAAHATSPSTTQGASLAIEDAVILAQCLRDIHSAPDAFKTFERLRRDRVERVVQSGASGENPVPKAPQPQPANPAESVFDHHIDWAETARP